MALANVGLWSFRSCAWQSLVEFVVGILLGQWTALLLGKPTFPSVLNIPLNFYAFLFFFFFSFFYPSSPCSLVEDFSSPDGFSLFNPGIYFLSLSVMLVFREIFFFISSSVPADGSVAKLHAINSCFRIWKIHLP